jgi:hypothetical protein
VEENMTPMDVILNGLNIRGREYVDCDEYLDEVQQYRLDALKEGRAEQEEEKEEEDGREGTY